MEELKAVIENPKLNSKFVSIKVGNETVSKFKKSEIVSIGKSYGESDYTDDTLISLSNGIQIMVNEDLKTVTKKLRI